MTNTWSHLCNTTNSFNTLPLTQECKACGIDYRVQAMRYEGYIPSLTARKTVPANNTIKTKLAALLRPQVKQPTIDEHQHSYYDRQG